MEDNFPKLIKDLGMLKPKPTSKYLIRHSLYRCKCGKEFVAIVNNIKNGKTSSCGCAQKLHLSKGNPKHGLSNNPIYKIWHGMHARCYNEKHNSYKYYGGEGVIICDEWHDLSTFVHDMESSYLDGLSIDRINTGLWYSKENCRWATSCTQNQNKRAIQSNNSSGYRGVSMDNKSKKWRAQIYYNLKRQHLGTFATALEAAKAYNSFVIDNNLEHQLNVLIDIAL